MTLLSSPTKLKKSGEIALFYDKDLEYFTIKHSSIQVSLHD